MSRTIWEWLGIEETTDRSLIRKAYARQAAKYHPEEAPEEAQQLREAYKRALALADRMTGDSGSEEKEPAGANEEFPQVSPDRDRKPDRHDLQEQGRKEPEPETAQSPGCRYAQGEGKEEPETVKSPGYRYGHYEDRDGMDQGSGSASEKGDKYQIRQLDAERAERARRLGKRFIELYDSLTYRYSTKHWTEAIKENLTKEDLQDPLVIAILLSLLERMQELDYKVWRVLERELLRYARKDVEWIQLRNRFAYACRLSGAESRARQANFRSENQSGQAERETAALDGGKRILWRAAVLAVAFLVFFMGSRFRKEQERERKMLEMINSMSSEVLVTQRYDTGNDAQDVSFSNYYIDLNGDGCDDRIRNDFESGSYVVEYYDPATDEYVLQGTVDQYLEENPDSAGREELLYFLNLPSE